MKRNGQVSIGNLREMEISISPLGNYGNCVRFPKISATKHVVKFHHFLHRKRAFTVTRMYILVGGNYAFCAVSIFYGATFFHHIIYLLVVHSYRFVTTVIFEKA